MRLIDFKDNFPNEAACKAEFKLLREKSGIVCKKCKGNSHYWLASTEMYQCKNNSCRFRTSLKSGTVMENSRMSYFNWFLMAHLISSTKNDFSTLELQRQIGHKYYEPVFFMAHKLRLVLGKRDSIYTLEGSVEMDEGYFTHTNPLEINEFTGEKEELKRGVGSQKKSKVLVMNSIFKVKPSIKKSKHKHNSIPKYIKMTVMDDYFTLIENSENSKIYHGTVYSKSLKRDVSVVIVNTKKKEKWSHKIYMTTDLKLTADKILEYYQTRFQIEFSDGKQHTGLNDCQARSQNKLDFHFNMSLTTINIAKITHWISVPKEKRKSFSMADIKTRYHSELLMNRIFIMFGIKPNDAKK